ncbi:MAG: copper resistance D family protein [Gammaproteobacteria bacterium]
MTQLAGFLDVVLRGLALIGLATSIGGVPYALWSLRPLQASTSAEREAVRLALHWVMLGAMLVAAARAVLTLVLQPWTLAEPGGRWPLVEFLGTDHARAMLASIGLAVALAGWARWLRNRPYASAGWWGLAGLALGLGLSSAWLSHAVSRLEGQGTLMAVTVLHQTGGLLWAGGVLHLGLLWRRSHSLGLNLAQWAAVLGRFSGLAWTAILLVLLPGVFLAWSYIGAWGGLVGTGYGVMVLTKASLLLCALALGGMNFLMVRHWRGTGEPGLAPRRVRAFIEAELGIGMTILLVAASLTSLPPAIDIHADRATPSEVLTRFTPSLPRLASPPVGELLAVAADIDDTLATRQPEEYAWSEYNHHMSGLFVLCMGLLAMLERTGKARWARHWPLLFLGLAAFMFARNDPRAWPLGPAGFWESMTLPDVLQHRIAVLLVIALGLFEWMVRRGRLAPRWRFVFPTLCAVGGALLLTHSHAMFNLKTEFLTEVLHAPLGFFAVLVGWGRWLELRVPESDRHLPGWIWSACFALIGFSLLMYREA